MDKKPILKTYKDLIAWQKAYGLCFKIYEMAKNFPKSEEYALTAQIKKSALSIPSNIAEGFNRYHNREYKQFLYFALGSCAEVETQIEICSDLKYINNVSKDALIQKIVMSRK